MTIILKILALLTSLVTGVFLIVETARSGLIIASTIAGILKFFVFLTFCALILFIIYLVVTSNRYPESNES